MFLFSGSVRFQELRWGQQIINHKWQQQIYCFQQTHQANQVTATQTWNLKITQLNRTIIFLNLHFWGCMLASWWFQPIWKNICQIWSFPQVELKNLWNHHLVFLNLHFGGGVVVCCSNLHQNQKTAWKINIFFPPGIHTLLELGIHIFRFKSIQKA